MKGFCLAHSFLSHDRLYKLYVLRTVPTVFPVQLSDYIFKVDEFVGEMNSELEPFVLYIRRKYVSLGVRCGLWVFRLDTETILS